MIEQTRPLQGASARAETLAAELARAREYDAAALRIAERIRSSLDLHDVLQLTVDELGAATGVSRSLIQLTPTAEGTALLIEWDRGDTRPLGLQPPTPVARHVLTTGRTLVVTDVAELDDPGIAGYLSSVGSASAVSLPIAWHGRIVAVLGFQDSRPRLWDDALPLLERLEAQIAAAIAQAELFDQQLAAIESLRDVGRMRDELVANVSHELRTPLTAVLGSVQTLRSLRLDDGRREELLEVLESQTRRLVRLAEDLLDLSRFGQGHRMLERRRVRLSTLAARAGDGIDPGDGRRLRVELDGDAELVVDPHRLLQVVSNLLVNAVRHGAGDVHLRAGVDGGDAVLEVSDDGDGVPRGYEDEMFLPFSFRSDRSDSTGLGLSIARAIVEAHGGTLRYEPPLDGRRHRFTVRLPGAARG